MSTREFETPALAIKGAKSGQMRSNSNTDQKHNLQVKNVLLYGSNHKNPTKV